MPRTTSLACAAVLLLFAAPLFAQCAVAPPSACSRVSGMTCNFEPASTLSWPTGGPLCFSFPIVANGWGVVVIASGPCPATPVRLPENPFCCVSSLWPPIQNVIPLTPGNPASLCVASPALELLRGSGIPICLQGFNYTPNVCMGATHGYQLTL